MKAVARQYLDWLATQECIRCRARPVELAHVTGAISRKTGLLLPRRKNEAYFYCLPACPDCHRHAKDSLHNVGEQTFFDALGVTADRLVASHFARFFFEKWEVA